MAIVPRNPADQIRFYRTHVPVWAAEPDAIGLTAEITAELAARLAEAASAQAEAFAARNAAEAATLRYHEAVKALRARGARAVASIKAYAGITDDPGVYARAQIDPPRTGGPARPVPAAPSITSVSVDSQGVCTIEWAAARGESVGPSSGSYYEVLRQRKGLGERTAVVVGSAAGLSLRDADVGPGETIYMVRSRRGNRVGDPSTAVAINLPAWPCA
ncbi:MAG: hypothetical protein KF768_12285, partial [Phycisphaeraceae bacterium]|nr:hypothetical protein [Phycisphaeraceae bacterium]